MKARKPLYFPESQYFAEDNMLDDIVYRMAEEERIRRERIFEWLREQAGY